MRGRIINKETSNFESVEIIESDFLSSFSLSWQLMDIPDLELVLPISYAKHVTGNSHVRINSGDWVYEGYVTGKRMNLKDHTVTVSTSHVVGKLSKRKMPTNVTAKQKTAQEVIYMAQAFWGAEEDKEDLVNEYRYHFVDTYASTQLLEYEFSNETLLDFFSKVCEKTEDLYWRVNRYNPYQIDFGLFGKEKEILVNEQNYLVELEDIDEDYVDVVNIAVAMSDKSDGGASSLTMRDIFYNKSLIHPDFPVIKTGNVVNSQRQYDYPQIPIFAPEIIGDEFAIIDKEGVALESGELYWGTITENDTQSVAEDNKEVTDTDRINATKQLYQSSIRRLKNSRRRITYNLTIKPFPDRSVQVGDKVMFSLNEGIYTLHACSRYYEKVLRASGWFFVTSLVDNFEPGNARIQQVGLSKYLYSDRDLVVDA